MLFGLVGTLPPSLTFTGVLQGFIAKMRKTGRRLVVFYGSQTGTAEEFAGKNKIIKLLENRFIGGDANVRYDTSFAWRNRREPVSSVPFFVN